tara:strand:+ start:278 stop:859 length:582 start_codon:yes stop_codon:yes gene_type:complete
MIQKLIDLDQDLFIYLNSQNSSLDSFWLFITNQNIIFTILCIVIFVVVFKYDRKRFKSTLFLILLTFIATDLIHNYFFKQVFQRLRPCHYLDVDSSVRVLVDCGGLYGFVSGHASNFFGIISIICFRIPNLKLWIKATLIIWGILICYSRIHVGKHYPLDVFFGAVLGCFLAYLIYQFIGLSSFSQKVYKKRN